MGVSEAYIRSRMDQITAETAKTQPELPRMVQDWSSPAQSMTSEEAENVILQNRRGMQRIIIRLLFRKKECLKRIPFLGKRLIRIKNRMLRFSADADTSREINLQDCEAWYFDDFLAAVYCRMLERMPDPIGSRQYREWSMMGAENGAVIYSVYRSDEFGQRKEVTDIERYHRSFRRFHWKWLLSRIPVVSWLIRPFFLHRYVEWSMRAAEHEAERYRSENRMLRETVTQNGENIREMGIQLQESAKIVQQLVKEQINLISSLLNEVHESGKMQLAAAQDLAQKADSQLQLETSISEKIDAGLREQVHLASSLLNEVQETGKIQQCAAQKADLQLQIETSISEKIDAGLAGMSTLHTSVSGYPGGVTGIIADGFFFGVPSEEWGLAMYLSRFGHFEAGTERFFENLLHPGMTVLDLGANLGMFTLRALRRGCSVYAFEPTKRIVEILRQNIKVNGFAASDRIRVIDKAVSDCCGTAAFFENPAMCGHNTMFSTDTATSVIETVSLDSLRQELPPVDVIKMDIEGAEYAALLGMEELLNENRNVQIIMEFAPEMIQNAGREPAELLDYLEKKGFLIQCINEDTGTTELKSREQLLQEYSINLYLRRSGV